MTHLLDKAKEFAAAMVASMKKPEAQLTAVGLKQVSRECLTFLAKIDVSNPYCCPIPICEVSYIFKSAGRVVAWGNMADPGSIKGNGTTRLEVVVKVPHDFLVSIMRDIVGDWDVDYEVEVGLIIDLPIIGDVTIPLYAKGEVKLPTLADLIF